IRQRAGNAPRTGPRVLLLAHLLASKHRALWIVRLVRALDLGEVDLGRALRPNAVLADERAQDVVHAPAERFLDLARVLETLHRRERTVLAGTAQEPPPLVDDRDPLRHEVGHARCDEMHDAGDALLVERASRMQVQEHRRAGLTALANEYRFARQREMDPRGLDAVERHDRARELAFERALVARRLGEPARAAEPGGPIEQLEAYGRLARQTLGREMEPRFVHLRRRNHQRAG